MRTFLHTLFTILLSSAIATACVIYILHTRQFSFHHDQQFVNHINNAPKPAAKNHSQSALDVLKRAAISGDAVAQFTLGTMYYLGNNVAKDNIEARFWFKVASSYGSLDGEVNLASMYKYGEGGDKDLQKSIELYTDAARKGSPAALYNLGKMYLQGDSLEKNQRYGTSLLQDSCRAGYEKSCQLLQQVLSG